MADKQSGMKPKKQASTAVAKPTAPKPAIKPAPGKPSQKDR